MSHTSWTGIDQRASAAGCWVVEMEEIIVDANQRSTEIVAQWRRRCIYRVPAWIENLQPEPDSRAYQPQLVSLGPYHHGCAHLLRMEAHKRRAVEHLLRNSGKPLEAVAAAVREVAEQLWDAYEDLGDEWKGDRFVKLMVTDGCFLLELFRVGALFRGDKDPEDYDSDDPFFNDQSYLYSWDVLKADMLVMGNQLPLLLLRTLQTIQRGTSPKPGEINKLVLDFLCPEEEDESQTRASNFTDDNLTMGLHPLDVYRRRFCGPHQNGINRSSDILHHHMPSAVELHEAGIHFKAVQEETLQSIHFERGVLTLPVLSIYDSTQREFLNMMAFERLHPRAGNAVTEYVVFMGNLINSAADVALLCSKGVIVNLHGSNEEVATLVSKILSKEAVISRSSNIHYLQSQVTAHCQKLRNKLVANFLHTYLSNPWVFISLLAAFILLVAAVMQTVYTVLAFYDKRPS